MFNLLRRLLPVPAVRRTGAPQRQMAARPILRRALTLEALEARDLMASISFSAATGIVTINGSSEDDVAHVSVMNNQVKVDLTCYSSAPPNLSFFTASKSYAVNSVKEIVFNGLDGNDTFTNDTAIKATADGGSGNDQLNGGSGNDDLIGNYGQDTIHGNGGNDTVWGSGGSDQLYGDAGDDLIKGHGGDDALYGGSGNDSLYGGSGNDSLYGDSGNDLLVSIGGGTDTLTGGFQWDDFWMDTTDILTDSSLDENALGHVHAVDQFFSYSYDGGQTSTPVSKELDGQNLADPLTYLPSHTYQDFSGDPLFASAGPTRNDIDQNYIPNCYFMATLGSVAQANPDAIRQLVVDLGDGTYAVNFKNGAQDEFVRVDGDLPTAGGALVYAGLGQQNSIWVPIVEKAWAFYRDEDGQYKSTQFWQRNTWKTHLHDDFASFGFGVDRDVGVATAYASQGSTDYQRGVAMLQDIQTALLDGKAVTITGTYPLTSTTQMVAANSHSTAHEYTVCAVTTDANGNLTGLTLRNPYAWEQPDNGYSTITPDQVYYICGQLTILTV